MEELMRLRNLFVVAISALLLITGATTTGAAPEAKEVYIIKFADNVNLDNEIATLKAGGGEVRFEYRNVFKGAAVEMNSAQAAGLSRNPKIERISKDQIASTQVPLYSQSVTLSGLWGLDRIDQVSAGSNKTYSYTSRGTGVTAYVVDTGIDVKNTEFGGRAIWDRNFADTNNSDCTGHGTHVAGTIGSRTYGVAKDVTLRAVKVLNCSGRGSYSGIIAALDYIKSQNRLPAVVNMSLGGPKDDSLNAAVKGLVDAGFVVVVAAGNETTDACTRSPASAPSAITIGASTSANVNASYSNFGNCVDIFAPGSGILSTTPRNKTDTFSGTSMASPHVAGVVARLLSTGTISADIDSTLKSSASRISLQSNLTNTGTTNVLLYANPEN